MYRRKFIVTTAATAVALTVPAITSVGNAGTHLTDEQWLAQIEEDGAFEVVNLQGPDGTVGNP